jgi:hypothetical protein
MKALLRTGSKNISTESADAFVKHPWTGLRWVWAKEGAVINWDQIMPKGFHVLPEMLGHRAHQCLDHPLPSAFPRL